MTGDDSLDEGNASPSTDILDESPSPRTEARRQGDFARLIPANRLAQYAFSEVVDRMKLDPDWNPHARRFIHPHEEILEQTLNIKTSDVESESEREPSTAPEAARVWMGWYSLNIEQDPAHPNLGWLIGAGRQDLGDRSVDLLLTLQKKKYNVLGRHARLFHHSDSSVLMLDVSRGKTVLLNGNRIEGQKRALASIRNGISFGDLAYTFEFTGLSDAQYREQLAQLRRKKGEVGEVSSDWLEVTPSEAQYEYRGYTIRAPFGTGTYGVVCEAVRNSTGDAVAVKRVKRTQSTMAAVGLEVGIYKRITPHPNVCNLIEDIYSRGDRYFMGPGQVDDVYLFHEPLARDTFVKLMLSKPDIGLRMAAFLQVLEGLRHMHSCGIMHRDIKPSNLMVATYEPLRVVIIDYGHATRDIESTDHYKGTIPYLAPEVLALKYRRSSPAYNRACDTWSAGLTGYQLFLLKPCDWVKGVNKAIHREILRQLEHHTPEMPVCRLLIQLLAWNADDRPTMSQLMADPMWNPYKGQLERLIEGFTV